MGKIKIDYIIHSTDFLEMESMSVDEFKYEFSSIYGQFAMNVGEYNFLIIIREFDFEIPFGNQELLDTLFSSLLYVTSNIEDTSILYMKYIENNVTWLKFEFNQNKILKK